MKKKKVIFFLISVILLISFVIAYAEDRESPFEITLVIPQRLEHRQRQISKSFTNKPEFHVLLKNISDEPQTLWNESCSWGYSNLSFEMVLDGRKIVIEKNPVIEWEKDFPDYWTLLPDEYYVFDIYITSDIWNFPKIEEASKVVQLKAIYENTSSSRIIHFKDKPDKKLDNFWTGQIESDPLEIVIYHW